MNDDMLLRGSSLLLMIFSSGYDDMYLKVSQGGASSHGIIFFVTLKGCFNVMYMYMC